jgi:phosphoribosylformylglycinamidine synthase
MKFGVITFPGSNCDRDLVHVLRNILGQPVVELWHKDPDLQGVDMVMLPGGFSYGDYLRSGAIARFSPVMQSVATHAAQGGLVMGICNGFQILCEAGLLPGALIRNQGQTFRCEPLWIRPATRNHALTAQLDAPAYCIPIAHAEGNYYADADTLKALQDQDQILFQYCTPSGEVTPEANPNGSLLNIAGVCNAQRNVMGMMPHPERAADPILGNTDGLALFESLLARVPA